MKPEHPAMKAAGAVCLFLAKDGNITGSFPVAKIAEVIDKAYQSTLGSKGGKASGARKARTPEQASKAAKARWDMRKPYTISPEGTETAYEPANGKVFILDELQKAVGGYAEVISRTQLPVGMIMLANGDGRQKNLPANPKASLLANVAIVGTVLICPFRMMR